MTKNKTQNLYCAKVVKRKSATFVLDYLVHSLTTLF